MFAGLLVFFLCSITLIVEDFSHCLKVLAELYNNVDTIVGGVKPMEKQLIFHFLGITISTSLMISSLRIPFSVPDGVNFSSQSTISFTHLPSVLRFFTNVYLPRPPITQADYQVSSMYLACVCMIFHSITSSMGPCRGQVVLFLFLFSSFDGFSLCSVPIFF